MASGFQTSRWVETGNLVQRHAQNSGLNGSRLGASRQGGPRCRRAPTRLRGDVRKGRAALSFPSSPWSWRAARAATLISRRDTRMMRAAPTNLIAATTGNRRPCGHGQQISPDGPRPEDEGTFPAAAERTSEVSEVRRHCFREEVAEEINRGALPGWLLAATGSAARHLGRRLAPWCRCSIAPIVPMGFAARAHEDRCLYQPLVR